MSHGSTENLAQNKRPRGRPPTFSREDRDYLADLIRQHGIAGAKRESRLLVCQQTLINIAREFEIILAKGRRPKTAA